MANNVLDVQLKNRIQIFVAHSIGSIPKGVAIEHRRLSSYKFHPPMNSSEIRVMAIDNLTNHLAKNALSKTIETEFRPITNKWKTIDQEAFKQFVHQIVDKSIERVRTQLKLPIYDQTFPPEMIVQRLIFNEEQFDWL